MALTAWGDRWVGPDAGPPILFQHACGEVVAPTVTCPACHDTITVDTITTRPGPGRRAAPGTQLLGARGASSVEPAEPAGVAVPPAGAGHH